jgi:ribosomal protein S18 acetylase RimI-like enzyme
MASTAHFVTIRPAAAGDVPALAALRYDFRAALAPPVEPREAFIGRAALWLGDRLAGEAWRAWAAVDGDGRIVGHLFLQFVEKIPNPVEEGETIGYITNVFVAPALRNQGIGARLVAEAMAACQERKVATVVLWPTERSVSLYRRFGFDRPRHLLERPLHDDDL